MENWLKFSCLNRNANLILCLKNKASILHIMQHSLNYVMPKVINSPLITSEDSEKLPAENSGGQPKRVQIAEETKKLIYNSL